MGKVIFGNIRKAKTSMIILAVLIFLASMLMNIGLTVALSINSFFDEKVKELDAPDLIHYASPASDELKSDLLSISGADKVVLEEGLLVAGASIKKGDIDIANSFIFLNADNTPPVKIIHQADEKGDNSIILPLSYRDSYGYKTGDTIKMKLSGQDVTYKVYGFFEDIFLGASAVTLKQCYVFDSAYRYLKDELLTQVSRGVLAKPYLSEGTNPNDALDEVVNAIGKHVQQGFSFGLTRDIAKQNNFMFVNILVMIIIGFSFIMVIVSLIVVGFSIISSVEDGIQNIGMLKSLGYKNSQVLLAFMAQYGGVAVLGSVLGVLCSVFALPSVGGIVAQSAGFLWELTFNLPAVYFSLALIIGLVLLITFLCASKTKKITPIIALRSGLQTHNFKRNPFPLSKSGINVNLAIALKNSFRNLKQNAMIFVIVTALAFASVFSLNMYSNMVEDPTALLQKIGVPLADVWFWLESQPEKHEGIFDEIAAMPEVVHVSSYQNIALSVQDVSGINGNASKDFSEVPRNTILSGRYPIHDNEVSVSSVILNRIGKTLGDIVSVTAHGQTLDFLVCGITEQLADNSIVVDITEGGVARFIPDYKVNGIVIKLADSVDTKEFIKLLEEKYGDLGVSALDIETTLDNILLSFRGGISVLMSVVIIIMLMVITLILFMIINMKIRREKTNIGIFKAGGFTTIQLMSQIALSFTMVVFLGTIAGATLGGAFSNSFVAILLSSMGVSNINFMTNYTYIAYLIIAITLYAFVISNLISVRIRKITAYHLLVE